MRTNLTHASVLALALLIGGTGISSAYSGLDNGNKFDRAKLTDQQKEIYNQIHKLRMNGDFYGADALRKQLGFPYQNQMRHRGEMNIHREKAQSAVSNNDYIAFQTAVEGSPMEDVVTPEVFSKMVKAHKLRNAGDLEGAQEIIKELGDDVRTRGEKERMRGKGGLHKY